MPVLAKKPSFHSGTRLLDDDSSAVGPPGIPSIVPLRRRRTARDHHRPEFESLLAESLDQMRASAEGNLAVMARMLGALETLSDLTVSPRRRRAIRDQVQWLAEVAGRTIESKHDRDRLARRLTDVREALKTEPALSVEEEKE